MIQFVSNEMLKLLMFFSECVVFGFERDLMVMFFLNVFARFLMKWFKFHCLECFLFLCWFVAVCISVENTFKKSFTCLCGCDVFCFVPSLQVSATETRLAVYCGIVHFFCRILEISGNPFDNFGSQYILSLIHI